MAYGDSKDLPRGAAADKVLRDKTFNIAKNPKYDGYKRLLSSNTNKGAGIDSDEVSEDKCPPD